MAYSICCGILLARTVYMAQMVHMAHNAHMDHLGHMAANPLEEDFLKRRRATRLIFVYQWKFMNLSARMCFYFFRVPSELLPATILIVYQPLDIVYGLAPLTEPKCVCRCFFLHKNSKNSHNLHVYGVKTLLLAKYSIIFMRN